MCAFFKGLFTLVFIGALIVFGKYVLIGGYYAFHLGLFAAKGVVAIGLVFFWIWVFIKVCIAIGEGSSDKDEDDDD